MGNLANAEWMVQVWSIPMTDEELAFWNAPGTCPVCGEDLQNGRKLVCLAGTRERAHRQCCHLMPDGFYPVNDVCRCPKCYCWWLWKDTVRLDTDEARCPRCGAEVTMGLGEAVHA